MNISAARLAVSPRRSNWQSEWEWDLRCCFCVDCETECMQHSKIRSALLAFILWFHFFVVYWLFGLLVDLCVCVCVHRHLGKHLHPTRWNRQSFMGFGCVYSSAAVVRKVSETVKSLQSSCLGCRFFFGRGWASERKLKSKTKNSILCVYRAQCTVPQERNPDIFQLLIIWFVDFVSQDRCIHK